MVSKPDLIGTKGRVHSFLLSNLFICQLNELLDLPQGFFIDNYDATDWCERFLTLYCWCPTPLLRSDNDFDFLYSLFVSVSGILPFFLLDASFLPLSLDLLHCFASPLSFYSTFSFCSHVYVSIYDRSKSDRPSRNLQMVSFRTKTLTIKNTCIPKKNFNGDKRNKHRFKLHWIRSE